MKYISNMITFEEFFVLYIINRLESQDNISDIESQAEAVVAACLSNGNRSSEEDEMLKMCIATIKFTDAGEKLIRC